MCVCVCVCVCVSERVWWHSLCCSQSCGCLVGLRRCVCVRVCVCVCVCGGLGVFPWSQCVLQEPQQSLWFYAALALNSSTWRPASSRRKRRRKRRRRRRRRNIKLCKRTRANSHHRHVGRFCFDQRKGKPHTHTHTHTHTSCHLWVFCDYNRNHLLTCWASEQRLTLLQLLRLLLQSPVRPLNNVFFSKDKLWQHHR